MIMGVYQGPGGPRPSARALLRPDRQAPLPVSESIIIF